MRIRMLRATVVTTIAAVVSSGLMVSAASATEVTPSPEPTVTSTPATPATFQASAPTITGTAQVGKTVTARPGAWTPLPTLFIYKWFADGVPIAGQVSDALVVPATIAGKKLTVTVTGRAEGYADLVATSAGVVVKAGTIVASKPTISGSAKVGAKLSASRGTWTPTPSKVTYQWYANSVPIAGATAQTLTVPSTVYGKRLKVKVTGALSGYTTAASTSAEVTAGAGALTAPTPKISGSTKVGATLTAVRGTWKPAVSTFTYQWRANGSAIKGATRSTFKIPSSLHGKKITVTITGKKSGYASKSVTSASVLAVAPFKATRAPSITGTAKYGSTLTAHVSGWSPAPSTVKYQWRANGAAISGATGKTYRPSASVIGKKITVTVTGSRSAYVTQSRTSAATKAVAKPSPTITRSGMYKVGSQIAPGTYISSGVEGCYWERRSSSGSSLSGVIANDFADGVRIVTIASTDKYFLSDECGTWTRYVPAGSSPRSSTALEGTYRVGTLGGQLRPGLYYTNGGGDGYCYYETLSAFSGDLDDIIENDFFSGSTYVRIYSSDVGFSVSGCKFSRVSN